MLVTTDNLTLLRWDEVGYSKQKFNITNFKEVLSCVEIITAEFSKYNQEWTSRMTDGLADPLADPLAESLQNLRLEPPPPPSSITQELKVFSILLNT